MLLIKPDPALISKFNMAEAGGASVSELKKIQLEISSSYGVGLNEKIYRVVDIDHFSNDFKKNTFTLSQISTATWGATSQENPLSRRQYTLEDGTNFTINTHDYFGSCWSLNPNPECSFRNFGCDYTSIRIESTVQQILSELINTNDIFYSLHYHVGPITYKPQKEIDDWLKNQPYDSHLDSTGRGLAQTLLILPNSLEDEKETRFIYLHQPQYDQWVNDNVKIEITHLNKPLCKHPFNWNGIVNRIAFDSRMRFDHLELVKGKLRSLGLNIFS